MTKEQILTLFNELHQINLPGVKFSYGISKNINLLKPEVEAIEKSLEGSKEFKEYDEKRIEIVKKYAKKDERGEPKLIILNPKTGAGRYEIENQEAFDREIEKLQKENKVILEKREKQFEEYGKLLKEESDFKPHKIKLSDVPEGITSQQMSAIFELIEDKK
jgi:hypothetical protein